MSATKYGPYDWEQDSPVTTVMLSFSPLEVSLLITALETSSSAAARDLAAKVKTARRAGWPTVSR